MTRLVSEKICILKCGQLLHYLGIKLPTMVLLPVAQLLTRRRFIFIKHI